MEGGRDERTPNTPPRPPPLPRRVNGARERVRARGKATESEAGWRAAGGQQGLEIEPLVCFF